MNKPGGIESSNTLLANYWHATTIFPQDNSIIPQFSFYSSDYRLKVDINGGAWCPKHMVSRALKEYLQIDLLQPHVITAVRTQGRFGRGQGQEYTEAYVIEYWRPGMKWTRWKNAQGKEVSTELVEGIPEVPSRWNWRIYEQLNRTSFYCNSWICSRDRSGNSLCRVLSFITSSTTLYSSTRSSRPPPDVVFVFTECGCAFITLFCNRDIEIWRVSLFQFSLGGSGGSKYTFQKDRRTRWGYSLRESIARINYTNQMGTTMIYISSCLLAGPPGQLEHVQRSGECTASNHFCNENPNFSLQSIRADSLLAGGGGRLSQRWWVSAGM